jgi:hypothetical protein
VKLCESITSIFLFGIFTTNFCSIRGPKVALILNGVGAKGLAYKKYNLENGKLIESFKLNLISSIL